MNLCLWGSGQVGKNFLEFYLQEIDLNKYETVYFVDSNEKLDGTEWCGYPVKKTSYVCYEDEVIITSSYFQEIYSICLDRDLIVLGIYDQNTNCLYSYKDMCIQSKTFYRNELFCQYSLKLNRKIDSNIEKFKKNFKIFENITEICFGLSNLCNYACFHKRCPANHIEKKIILPSRVFFKTIDELKEINFDGTICFHVYNEPLMDPRLFWFVDYVKEKIPDAAVEIYSNGYYLNDQMVDELQKKNIDVLVTTGYGEEEYRRLINLKVDIPHYVLWGKLDERLVIYDGREQPIVEHPCRCLLAQVNIFPDGDIGLCCLDYKHPYCLGNIYDSSLKECLNSQKVIALQKELLAGNRNVLPICQQCVWETR